MVSYQVDVKYVNGIKEEQVLVNIGNRAIVDYVGRLKRNPKVAYVTADRIDTVTGISPVFI
jgi:hypothetical protein